MMTEEDYKELLKKTKGMVNEASIHVKDATVTAELKLTLTRIEKAEQIAAGSPSASVEAALLALGDAIVNSAQASRGEVKANELEKAANLLRDAGTTLERATRIQPVAPVAAAPAAAAPAAADPLAAGEFDVRE